MKDRSVTANGRQIPASFETKVESWRNSNQFSTMSVSFSMAGGFTDLARPNRVIVLRNTPSGPQRIKIDIKQAISADSSAIFYLQPLDTVYVEGR